MRAFSTRTYGTSTRHPSTCRRTSTWHPSTCRRTSTDNPGTSSGLPHCCSTAASIRRRLSQTAEAAPRRRWRRRQPSAWDTWPGARARHRSGARKTASRRDSRRPRSWAASLRVQRRRRAARPPRVPAARPCPTPAPWPARTACTFSARRRPCPARTCPPRRRPAGRTTAAPRPWARPRGRTPDGPRGRRRGTDWPPPAPTLATPGRRRPRVAGRRSRNRSRQRPARRCRPGRAGLRTPGTRTRGWPPCRTRSPGRTRYRVRRTAADPRPRRRHRRSPGTASWPSSRNPPSRPRPALPADTPINIFTEALTWHVFFFVFCFFFN